MLRPVGIVIFGSSLVLSLVSCSSSASLGTTSTDSLLESDADDAFAVVDLPADDSPSIDAGQSSLQSCDWIYAQTSGPCLQGELCYLSQVCFPCPPDDPDCVPCAPPEGDHRCHQLCDVQTCSASEVCCPIILYLRCDSGLRTNLCLPAPCP